MKKIYAAVSSEWGSEECVAMFSNEERAEEFCEVFASKSYETREYTLDPDVCDKIKQGLSIWRIEMLRTGEIDTARELGMNHWDTIINGHELWRRSESQWARDSGVQDVLVSEVWARDREPAIKNANEHRMQMITNGEWD